jgi:D-glycerate 3-kinase
MVASYAPLAAQVLFEGWMLGFRPVGAEAVAAVDKDLVEIDKVLRGYEAAWDAHVDAWLVIKARRPACSPGPSHLLARTH